MGQEVSIKGLKKTIALGFSRIEVVFSGWSMVLSEVLECNLRNGSSIWAFHQF
ncbi:Class-10 pathogenesis-related protein 1 [Senna tora]|uniref:Class-10 pathogenesis-related protein 1 n=1 Tax=Senna tora TaxID=362788 RepID=A0A834X4C3_9FABA|nr:Class-10 pathogenesis-related protein 1 [Senna tora]